MTNVLRHLVVFEVMLMVRTSPNSVFADSHASKQVSGTIKKNEMLHGVRRARLMMFFIIILSWPLTGSRYCGSKRLYEVNDLVPVFLLAHFGLHSC